MSEISALSNQYETVVKTTDKFNNSIIALKKHRISKEKSKTKDLNIILSADEFKKAKDYILEFLEYILQIQNENTVESGVIPVMLIKDFSNRIKSTIPYIEKIIPDIIEILIKEGELSVEQFQLLDKIAATLDNERTVLFRKLKTARG